MSKYSHNGPSQEQIKLVDRAIDTTITILQPFVYMARGAIKGASEGWHQVSEYQAMQRAIASMEVEDFYDTSDDAQ